MFTITSRDLTVITPIIAAELIKKNIYEHQRKIRPVHVKKLVEAIADGTFTTGKISVAKNGTDQEYLMNGQHQLTAVLTSGKPIFAILEKVACDSKKDLADVFALYDTEELTRSPLDVVRAKVSTMDVDWYDKTKITAASALSLLLNPGKETETKSKRAARIVKYREEVEFVNQFLGCENKHLHRSAVVAVMISSYWKNKELAQEFWAAVASGEMLKKNDPRLTLRTFLVAVQLDAGGRSMKNKECRVRCIHSWNAWRRGGKTNLKYNPEKPIPALV